VADQQELEGRSARLQHTGVHGGVQPLANGPDEVCGLHGCALCAGQASSASDGGDGSTSNARGHDLSALAAAAPAPTTARMRRTPLLMLALLGNDAPPPPAAFAGITEKEVAADVAFFADPGLEGRDTPSAGLEHAATHIEEELHAAGLKGLGKDGSLRLP